MQHFGMPTFFLHVECNHSTKSLSEGYVTRARELSGRQDLPSCSDSLDPEKTGWNWMKDRIGEPLRGMMRWTCSVGVEALKAVILTRVAAGL
jgi:hypothetical protein